MHYIQRAIILATAKDHQMSPLSEAVAKPLLEVGGRPLIETVIDGLRAHRIREIYVVVGHLKAQFKYLLEKYSGLTLIVDPHAETAGSISALYVARQHLVNAIVIAGNQLIIDPVALRPAFTRYGYNATVSRKPAATWGISRWTPRDAAYLEVWLAHEFEQQRNHHLAWEAVFERHADEFDLAAMEMVPGAAVGIDSPAQLAAIRAAYE